MVPVSNREYLRCHLSSPTMAKAPASKGVVDAQGNPLNFNIGHWFRTLMVLTEYLFWWVTFEDVLYLNRLTNIVMSDVIPPKTTTNEGLILSTLNGINEIGWSMVGLKR